MGIQDTVINATQIQKVINTVMQESNAICKFDCSNTIDGVDISLIGTTIGGDISITNTCVIDNTQCTIKQALDSQMENMLDEQFQLTEKLQQGGFDPADILNALLPWNIGVTTINLRMEQIITNQISQLANATCIQSADNNIRDVRIYAAQSSIGGSINIANSGSITQAECNLENVTRSAIANTLTESADIDISFGGSGSCGTAFGYLGVMIIGIMALGIIAALFSIGRKIMGTNNGGTSKELVINQLSKDGKW